MKSFFSRILRVLLLIALFIITWGVLSGGISTFLSWKGSGAIQKWSSPINFDVLVVVPKKEGDGSRIERVMFANLPGYLEGLEHYSFILPGEIGKADSEEHINVTYKAKMIDGGRQLVEVSYFDGDRRTLSRYEATDKKVVPLHKKERGGQHAIIGGAYGFFIAILLFIVVKLVNRRTKYLSLK